MTGGAFFQGSEEAPGLQVIAMASNIAEKKRSEDGFLLGERW